MRGRTGGLDYSAYKPEDPPEERRYPEGLGASSLMIDATLKWNYPPTSLPKKQYMENALQIWNELGLEPLKLKMPWYGYNLGYWTKDDEENAELIVRGDYRAVGRKLLKGGA
jgi:4-hydroxy-3-polyprenylbenzoate decarboxylase